MTQLKPYTCTSSFWTPAPARLLSIHASRSVRFTNGRWNGLCKITLDEEILRSPLESAMIHWGVLSPGLCGDFKAILGTVLRFTSNVCYIQRREKLHLGHSHISVKDLELLYRLKAWLATRMCLESKCHSFKMLCLFPRGRHPFYLEAEAPVWFYSFTSP